MLQGCARLGALTSAVMLVVATLAGGAHGFEGQLSTKFKIDDDSPESSVPTDQDKNQNPLEFGYFVQDLLTRAEQARKQKNYSALVHYDRAVAKATPEQARGWGQLCEAYRLVNDRERAARSCKNAISRPGAALNDFVLFVRLTVEKPEPLTSDERHDLNEVLDHLDQQPSLNVTASQLRCQVGVKTGDIRLLETCTAALAKAAPDDAATIIYRWSLAVRKGQNGDAARLLARARDLGVPSDNLARMQRFTPAVSRRWPIWSGVGAALLLGALLWAFWSSRRRRALAHPAAL